MPIEIIRLYAYSVPFVRPFMTATGTVTDREGLLVEIVADGLIGLGEGALLPGDERNDEVVDAARIVANTLLGFGPQDALERMGRGAGLADVTLAARAALDIAVHDLIAQQRGLPVAHTLEAVPRDEVEVNAVIGGTTVSDAVSQAQEALRAGFWTLKLKVGLAPDADGERELVAAVRSAVGPEVKLRLDANGAWDEAAATRVLTALEDLDIELLEQPLAAGDLDGMRRLRAVSSIPIAADEAVVDEDSARAILSARAADYLVLKPLKLGGLGPSLTIARLASGAGVGCVVTTSLDSGAGTAAALHLAAVMPENSPAAGLATASLLVSTLVGEEMPVVGGKMRVPVRPGLGVSLDRDALARYAVRALELL